MHKPVLLNEILDYLNPKSGDVFIDCTLGFGGHSLEIAKRILPNGKLLAIEQDQETLNLFKKEIKNSDLEKVITPVCGNFSELELIAEEERVSCANGILLDLGISSWQIDESGRGFSFRKDEPLIMTLNNDSELTAAEIVNHWKEEEISRIIKEYGEERFHRRIAKRICQARKEKVIKTTGELVDIIRQALPGKYRHKHFATRTFQALRIAVNKELENLEKVLPQAMNLLEAEGRLAVISFHSLEDRIVKNFFRDNFKNGKLEVLTKKPIISQKKELENNIRSRSAKLRVASKK